MARQLFLFFLLNLPWWAGAAQPLPRAALVIDTSGSMADNDPRRYAVHFAKVLGRTMAGAGAVDTFHAGNADCRAESVVRYRLDGADPTGWERSLERGVRYAGFNVFGPAIVAARDAPGSATPSVLLLLADNGGRGATEIRAETDAEIARRVAEAGGRHGNVDVRISLLWNTRDDLDLHVTTPFGRVIYYGNKNADGGVLDVDRNVNGTTRQPVENVRWARGQAPAGEYRVMVRNFKFNERRRRAVEFRVEVVADGQVKHYQGIISPNGETGSASDVEVTRFRYPVPRSDSDRAAVAAAVSRRDRALNPNRSCPDPEQALKAAQRAGIAQVSIQLGNGASPFQKLDSMDATLKLGNSAELTAAVATVAKRWLGRDALEHGASDGRIQVRVPRHTGELWLLVSGDGDLSRLRVSDSNPGAASVELDVAAGKTASTDGRSYLYYRLIRVREPTAGTWRFHADGVAVGWLYGLRVIHPVWDLRHDLPARHRLDIPLSITATLEQPGDQTSPVPGLILARAEGIEIGLRDDGEDGDATAGDRIYSGSWTPRKTGRVRFQFSGQDEARVETASAEVEVVGWADLRGPARIDFGSLASHEHSDRVLDLSASRIHGMAELALSTELAADGLVLELEDNGKFRPLPLDRPLSLVLNQDRRRWPLRLRALRCPPELNDQPIGELRVRSGDKTLTVTLGATTTEPLAWYICLWPYLLAVALFLLAAFVVWGFVSPARFPRTLGVVLSPEEDLDEGFFQLVRAAKGTGSGFYRNARAYIGADFRISGRREGAFVCLIADHGRLRIRVMPGQSILRRNPEDKWEPLTETDTLMHFGELYRNETGSLYFELRNA
ncbi:MAG: hypothetical protein LGR52_15085 [Candidatus Thiosymbion ectosymbiont of Robbea hypermnestra]|nr:hypothetical protein [Candidatus Thiosymbion ectosymbiont of Robbea hypermnestra]